MPDNREAEPQHSADGSQPFSSVCIRRPVAAVKGSVPESRTSYDETNPRDGKQAEFRDFHAP
jgi:hypothetical protein